MLPDAKRALELARYQYSIRNMKTASDLAQEALNLFQRVTETLLHNNILRCLDLTAAILFDVDQFDAAVHNASRALALAIQIGGFDSSEALSAHSTLSLIYLRAGQLALSVKHTRAALYLTELLGGRNYAELSAVYQRLGNVVFEVGSDAANALRCFKEVMSRPSFDLVLQAMNYKSAAYIHALLGQFKEAVASEKEAYRIYSLLNGPDSNESKSCLLSLQKFTAAAVQQGKGVVAEEQKRKEAEAAEAIASQIASQIEADEEEAEAKKKKKSGSKKKKKK
jgi:hypothetical protein